MHDSVGVDIKSNFDLWNPARSRRQTGQLKHSEFLVVGSHFALALKYLNLHAWLIVVSGRENFRALGGNRCVPLNELGHDSALRLDAKREWGYVKQKHVFDFASENTSLQTCTDGDNFVWVHALIRLSTTSERTH